VQLNLADLFESVVDAAPERTALVSGSQRLSYAELDARANRLASFLAARGIGAGDHVGLHLYNGHQFVEAMLAGFKLRAAPINLNYRYVAKELAYLVENAELAGVVTQRELSGALAEACAGRRLRAVVVVDDGSGAELAARLECIEYETALASGSAARPPGERSGDDHYVIYTGGTTGTPSGVVWRHQDVLYAGLQGGAPGGTPIERPEEVAERIRAGGVWPLTILPAAPFIHGAAQWSAFIGIFTAGKVVLQPGRSFDPRRICELIGEEQVGTITLVGDAMARPIADALGAGSYDTSSLRVISSAGAVLSPAVRQRLRELLPSTMVLNSFGASETGHQGSALPGSETGADGRPSFFMDGSNAVLDDDGRPLAAGSGKIGRLARRGRIPLGYYNDPKKTAERFPVIDGERWCVPGDFAMLEADGRITVLGRGAVCINSGGEKVFPEEVEEALKSHADVFDALVVGVSDERWMQRVAAVVAPRPGRAPTLEELQAHCRARIAGYKVPRSLVLVEAVARQPSGKPDYAWAREVAIAGAAR
jgi:acyl-CoA synthetase (AMP-forming)/AMP-acid ligase II